jgi:hypothetical protein
LSYLASAIPHQRPSGPKIFVHANYCKGSMKVMSSGSAELIQIAEQRHWTRCSATLAIENIHRSARNGNDAARRERLTESAIV